MHLLKSIIAIATVMLFLVACENREVNEDHSEDGGETFKDMPVTGIESHFNRIVVDEAEYLILERDRNNPHEGFGFMAFRPNKLIRKQDSIMAYLETVMQSQAEILSMLKKTSPQVEKDLLMRLYKEKLSAKKPVIE